MSMLKPDQSRMRGHHMYNLGTVHEVWGIYVIVTEKLRAHMATHFTIH
jgi:hypothetical protein